MIIIRDDDREMNFVNPEHIVTVLYRKPHPHLALDAKLVITTIRNELAFDGELATTVYDKMMAG